MAGIGFELRKIYSKKTMMSSISGTIYATMTTVGPTVLFMFLLFMLRFALDYFGGSEIESMFFVSSFTYAFVVAILVAALLNTALSRYISDKIFEKREDDICASMLGVIVVCSVLSGIAMLVLCVRLYLQDNVPISFLAVYYLLGVMATITYTLMNFISAIKEYKQVTLSFAIGLLTSAPVFLLLRICLHWNTIMSIYTSIFIAFLIINILMVFFCIRAFGVPSGNLFEFLQYEVRFATLLISGFTYMLGIYITNIIYWNFSSIATQVSIFKTAPNYDMAMFLALIINLPGMVMFVVKVETQFYDKYVMYLSALGKGSYNEIEKNRIRMQNVLRLQLFFVYDVQLVITVLAICAASFLFPMLGIGGQVLNLFMVLGMGMYCTFCMYFTIVFLYYFEDYVSACIAPCIFLAINVIGSFICVNLKNIAYYPLPLLAAGITGWVVSFLCLRNRLVKLNSLLLCK